MQPRHVALSFGVGTAAGAAGSLVGMGGAFITLPALTNVLKLTQHQAHGTSLACVMACGIGGAAGFVAADAVDFKAAACLAMAGMVTATLGARAANRLDGLVLKRLLGGLMICAAPTVILKAYLPDGRQGKGADHNKTPENDAKLDDSGIGHMIFMAGIGGVTGFLSGLFGVGGGSVTVPALSLTTDFSHYKALGTSMAAFVLPSFVGTVTHYRQGNVILRVAAPLALGTVFGAYVGGKYIAVNVDEGTLRLIFFTMMVVLGVQTARSAHIAIRARAAIQA